MGLRFSCKGATVALAGTTYNHLLQAIPDEWKMNIRGNTTAAIYVTAAPTSTSIIVAASGVAGSLDVFCNVNHTFIL